MDVFKLIFEKSFNRNCRHSNCRHLISSKTAFGRSIYAIGGNKEAAALSGINIKRNTLIVFGLMGALAGVAGIILTSRLNAATPGAGDMYELDAIASE